jgi:hypothetical protein
MVLARFGTRTIQPARSVNTRPGHAGRSLKDQSDGHGQRYGDWADEGWGKPAVRQERQPEPRGGDGRGCVIRLAEGSAEQHPVRFTHRAAFPACAPGGEVWAVRPSIHKVNRGRGQDSGVTGILAQRPGKMGLWRDGGSDHLDFLKFVQRNGPLCRYVGHPCLESRH